MGGSLPPVVGQAFSSSIAADLRRQVLGPDVLQLITTCNGIAPGSGTSLSDGVITSAVYRSSFLTLQDYDCYDVQFVFPNFYGTFDDLGEKSTPNSISIQSTFEGPVNTTYPLYYNNKQVTVPVIPAGEWVITDPLPFTLTKNTRYYTRTNPTVTSGQKWPTMRGGLTGFNDTFLTGATSSSLTSSGLTNTFDYVYEPLFILGKIKQSIPNVLIVGDSNSYGLGDTNDAKGFVGPWTRAMQNKYGVFKGCKSSESANAWVNTPLVSRRRQSLIRMVPFTHAIVMYGTNDLTASRTSTQIIADLTVIYQWLVDHGMKVIAVTILPHTSSSGGQWLNAADQTPTNGTFNTTHRNALNDWLMAGPANVSATYDLASQFQDAGDRTKWLTDGSTNKLHTNDGLHLKNTANAIAATNFAAWYPSYIF